MVFSVTYYLEVHNYLLYIPYFTNKCEIGILDIIEY